MSREVVSVQPHFIRGGINTIVQLANLFDIGVDAQTFGKPVLFITDRLTDDEVATLKELIKEYTIVST